MRIFPFLFLIFLLPQSHANPLLNGFQADYELSKNGTVLGVSHRQLTAREQGKKLDYASTTVPTGLVALFVSDRFMEHSFAYLTEKGIKPQRYEYQRTGGKKEIRFHALFDWDKKQIQASNHKQPQKLLPNTQDLLSFQLALMRGLSQGKKQFKFQIIDHKRVQLQTLEYKRTDNIGSSLGRLDVLKLQHHAEKSHYHFTFWCARQLDYLPIKITKTEQDGDIIQLKLKRFNKKAFYLYEPPTETNGRP